MNHEAVFFSATQDENTVMFAGKKTLDDMIELQQIVEEKNQRSTSTLWSS